MSKLSSFIALCAVFGVAWATIGSDLDDDNFRMLKEEEIRNDLQTDMQNDILDDADDSKLFFGGENPEQLPYENFETWDALKSNPPFPEVSSDDVSSDDVGKDDVARNNVVSDDWDKEIERVKREGLFSNMFSNKKNKNKMDEMIRETPKTAENSKFHGSFMLNDLENDNE